MAEQIVNISIHNPGNKGINSESAVLMDPSWAEELVDWVYNGFSELQVREGYRHIANTTFTDPIKSIYEYTDDAGVTRIICGAGSKIYSVDSLGNTTDVTGTVTATDGNWQFATFNGTCIGYQSGHAPIVLPDNSSTFAPATGTQYNGSMCVVAGGRIWTVYNNTLHYSDLLINDYGTGSAGSFDLDIYWPKGNDTAIALAEHNGLLIVFGRESIIIYQGYDDVSTMSLQDTIASIGCIARDSVQSTGMDITFLSNLGLISLGRLIQEKSLPAKELSRNIRKDMIRVINAEPNKDAIKATYYASYGLYAISFPQTQIMYLLDVTNPLQDGTYKVLSWSLYPSAMFFSQDSNSFYLSQDTGYLQKITGTKDGVNFSGSGGTDINPRYKSNWTVLSPDLTSTIKIIKSLKATTRGSSTYVTLGVAYDFLGVFHEVVATSAALSTPSVFGTATYASSTYSGLFSQQETRANMKSSGQTIQIKLEAQSVSKNYTLKRIDVRLKVGKLV